MTPYLPNYSPFGIGEHLNNWTGKIRALILFADDIAIISSNNNELKTMLEELEEV